MKLDRDRIVSAALELLEEQGLADLNMRALAGRLEVQASALYWHVGGKTELLSLMADRLYASAFAAVPAGLSWRKWLLAFGAAMRHQLLTHRDGARLCATASPSDPDTRRAARRTAAPLVAAGLTEREALPRLAAVISLTLGFALYEQSEGMHDFLQGLFDFERSHAEGLAALVAGFPASRHRVRSTRTNQRVERGSSE